MKHFSLSWYVRHILRILDKVREEQWSYCVFSVLRIPILMCSLGSKHSPTVQFLMLYSTCYQGLSNLGLTQQLPSNLGSCQRQPGHLY